MADTHSIQAILNGDLLRSKRIRRFYPLLGLIACLFFIYILTGYHSVKQQHRLTDIKKEMLDAKYQYMTFSAQLSNTTRLSKITTALKEQGSSLKANNKPPTKILN